MNVKPSDECTEISRRTHKVTLNGQERLVIEQKLQVLHWEFDYRKLQRNEIPWTPHVVITTNSVLV